MITEAETNTPNNIGTEQCLLEAADEVFAEFGYRGATVRRALVKTFLSSHGIGDTAATNWVCFIHDD